jgi:phosphinothricin acetyltransferase
MTNYIRTMAIGDLADVTAIFNDAIENTTGSFDSDPKTLDQMRLRFFSTDNIYPKLVTESQARVVAWASIAAYSDRCAYEDCGEVSIYVAPEMKGRGIGRKLLPALIDAGRQMGLHTLIARIGEGNPSSLALHRSAGFEEAGFLKEIGAKFGRRLSVHLMQIMLT